MPTDRQPKTRRQINERKNKMERMKRRKTSDKWPARDKDYRKFVSTFACVLCFLRYWKSILAGTLPIGFMRGAIFTTQACHMGPHGIGQKASDYTVIPMCDEHHEVFGSSIRKLESIGIDYAKLAASLRAQYEKERG